MVLANNVLGGSKGGPPDKLFLPATLFWQDYGSPAAAEYTPVGAGLTTAIPSWDLDDGLIEQVHTTIIVPSEYSDIDFEVIYAMKIASSGNIVFRLKVQSIALGERDQAGDELAIQTYAVPSVSLELIKQALTNAAPIAKDDIVGVGLGRHGSDGSDTANGDCHFIGLLLTFS